MVAARPGFPDEKLHVSLQNAVPCVLKELGSFKMQHVCYKRKESISVGGTTLE